MPYSDDFEWRCHVVHASEEGYPDAVNEDCDRVTVGQIRRSGRHSTFTVMRFYKRNYPDGSSAVRVVGFLGIKENDGIGSHERDLDLRSMMKMFPRILFDTISWENRLK